MEVEEEKETQQTELAYYAYSEMCAWVCMSKRVWAKKGKKNIMFNGLKWSCVHSSAVIKCLDVVLWELPVERQIKGEKNMPLSYNYIIKFNRKLETIEN